MSDRLTNIHDDALKVVVSPRGGAWRYLDLSGKNLGVRIEELAPRAFGAQAAPYPA
jgi:hypothetical protein